MHGLQAVKMESIPAWGNEGGVVLTERVGCCGFGAEKPPQSQVPQFHHPSGGNEHVRWLYICGEEKCAFNCLLSLR